MVELVCNRITPKRIYEAHEAFEELITEAIHRDWLDSIRTLKFFFEDLVADMENASHE